VASHRCVGILGLGCGVWGLGHVAGEPEWRHTAVLVYWVLGLGFRYP
jgi:hypothetical protein